MLTLFTGNPGAGKTAQMVCELEKLLKAEPGRPVYVDGVNGLTIPHTPIDASKWHTDLPDGALMLVDEAQRLWRPSGPGQKPPPEVQAMETHRHRGIDIWMTTQGPRLLHQNIRALIGRHIHLRDTGFLGRWWYEWSECNEGLAWKTCPNKARHKLPRHIFHLYKSASLHTKTSRRIPPLLYVAAVALVVLVVLVGMFIRSLSSKGATGAKAEPATVSTAGVAASAPSMGRVQVNAQPHTSDPTAFVARWSNRPESAPAYDEILRVKVAPRVVGGWCVGEDQRECRCVTQQGTAVLTSDQCREWLRSPPFDPFREPAAVAREGRGQAAAGS